MLSLPPGKPKGGLWLSQTAAKLLNLAHHGAQCIASL